jgi:hypothetical protein
MTHAPNITDEPTRIHAWGGFAVNIFNIVVAIALCGMLIDDIWFTSAPYTYTVTRDVQPVNLPPPPLLPTGGVSWSGEV